MKPPAKAPAKQPSLPNASNKKLLAILALALLVALIGFVLYRNYQHKQAAERAFLSDKSKMAVVEQEMEAALTGTRQLLGEPLKYEVERACGRSDVKFGKGALSCGVSFNYYYAETDLASADARTDKFVTMIDTSERFSLPATTVEVNDSAANYKVRKLNSTTLSNENCSVNVLRDNASYNENLRSLNVPFAGHYKFECSIFPKKPIF